MKTFIQTLFSFLLICSGCAQESGSGKFPNSEDSVQFQQEVKDYILYSSEFGLDTNRHGKKIELDHKDWESPLAEIIADPRKYSMGPTETALLTATIRKKRNDPKINAAAARLFQEAVQISLEKFDQLPEDQTRNSGLNTWISVLIAEIVELESPEALQSILIFLHSPEVDRFETLRAYDPKYIAPALQKYGDFRNAEEALKVAAKLESIGRADVATDIKRVAERIMKDNARKQATSPGGTAGSSKIASAPDGEAKHSASGKPLWPWLAAGGAIIAALAAYFRSKSARA